MGDRQEYQAKKQFFSRLLTVYGRNAVLEALQTQGPKPYRLHLADSNKPAAVLEQICQLAVTQGAEIIYHSRDALSRISKNKKQDQGVALDVEMGGFTRFENFIDDLPDTFELIALDKITNPQNLGMIIRTVCASPIYGLLLPTTGGAKIDPLVIKTSAGAVFKAPIIQCHQLTQCLDELKQHNTDIIGLSLKGKALTELSKGKRRVWVLGNESEGISQAIEKICTKLVKIPMNNEVESLNVAVTAGLIAFRSLL